MRTTFLQHGLWTRTALTLKLSSTRFGSSLSVFGDAESAKFLGAAGSPDSIPALHGLPEVVVTGRANAGKSTLFNAVLGRTNLLRTSKKAGRTQTLNFFRVGAEPGKLILVDAPGYGSRGREQWGSLFANYIQNRKVLRRVYILFNAKHGINQTDAAMLQSLNEQCMAFGRSQFTLQAVITKVDTVSAEQVYKVVRKMRKQIFEAAPICLPPILTSTYMKPQFGIEETRKSIAEACGLDGVRINGGRNR